MRCLMKGGKGVDGNFDLSLNLDGITRDLLPNRSSNGIKREAMVEEDEIELNLGLSMNGRFGIDPSNKKFKRSSSIANLVLAADSSSIAHLVNGSELVRTRSLPTAAEEEWRRRKEWHAMKRLQARKKRREKMKNVKTIKDEESGSIEIPTSCSSGASDLPHESKQDSQLAQKGCNKNEILFKGEAGKSFREMPFVSTKGDGLNKVDGFLYRYTKGEEVRIVCVCHGLFLSPAEFVKHGGGGGGEVEHPLKHIVVNPFPLL